ncbi:MAG TPA: divergent polysaccharide deacetylase family protein [Dongiaceae bacterium]
MRLDRTKQVRGPSISFGGPLLILFVFGLVGVAGLGFFLASTGKLRAFAPSLFASGGDLQMPSEPRRRSAEFGANSGEPGAATDAQPALAEMSPLAEPTSASPASSAPASTAPTSAAPAFPKDAAADTWPDIGPAALLEQAAAIPDRALNDTAFDLPPWRRYARPFAVSGEPIIGILVTGNGLNRPVTAAAIAGLPAEVSLSFSPYAPDLADWIAAARAFGHEALIDLPMQGKDFPAHDPGPLALLTALNTRELARRIDAMADSGDRSIGFASADGGALLLDDATTTVVLAEIQRLGRAFVETGAEPMSVAASDASGIGVPFARMTVRLDEVASRSAIATRLAVAMQLAQQRKAALAVTQATPLSITAIAEWARRQDQPAKLAPVTALLHQ